MHDPLINWRLVHHPSATASAPTSGSSAREAEGGAGSVMQSPMLAQVLTDEGRVTGAVAAGVADFRVAAEVVLTLTGMEPGK